MRSLRSNSVTVWPALFSSAAAARPDGAEPTTAALLRPGGGGQTGRAGADDGDLLAGPERRLDGLDPALVEGAVDDRLLDLLDRDGVVVDVEDACGLARRRADAAGELGEVVRRVQRVDRV